jgi:hypothetical protein
LPKSVETIKNGFDVPSCLHLRQELFKSLRVARCDRAIGTISYNWRLPPFLREGADIFFSQFMGESLAHRLTGGVGIAPVGGEFLICHEDQRLASLSG